MKTFNDMTVWVHEGARSKACDSSERRHIFEFLNDVVDNVDYDIQSGNYQGEDEIDVLRQQLVGSLQEIVYQASNALKELRK